MKLSFSQELGAGLKAMSLSTQSQSTGGMATQERPPVPLFADGPPVASAQLQPVPLPLDIPSLSQQDFLGTQDFVTPVDQFQLDYDPKDAKRSPARLSPDRVKRPRQGSSAGGCMGWGRHGRVMGCTKACLLPAAICCCSAAAAAAAGLVMLRSLGTCGIRHPPQHPPLLFLHPRRLCRHG